MIYILGMSHIISVVNAFAGAASPFHMETWEEEGRPAFQRLPAARSDSPIPSIGAALLTPKFGLPSTSAEGQENGEVRTDARYSLLLRSMGNDPSNILVTMMFGNEHSTISMIQHPVPYDFVLPWETDLPLLPGRQVLPYGVVASQMRKKLGKAVTMFRFIRASCPDLRVVQFLPPPPIPSEEQITRSHESFVAERYRKNYGLTPVSIRLKYYLLYARELESALRPLKIECVHPPAEAVGPDGTLLEPYWLEATHGNRAYGELVLKQIVDLTRTKR